MTGLDFHHNNIILKKGQLAIWTSKLRGHLAVTHVYQIASPTDYY